MKVMFFSLHAANWLHAFPEALVAEALKQDGMEICYITCSGQLRDYCICMASCGLTENSSEQEKQKICQRCHDHKTLIKREFGFDGYDLGDILVEEDRKALMDVMSRVRRDNFVELLIDGIPVGKIALYEFVLNHKKIDLAFSNDEWRAYQMALCNTLISFYASKRALDREKPDRVLTYNGLYSVNRVCCELAKARGIEVYFLHAGPNFSVRLQTIIVARGGVDMLVRSFRNAWLACKNIPCLPVDLRSVTDHFVELLKGNHFLAYSPGKKKNFAGIGKFFGIEDGKKLLVAVMSSYDERMAVEMAGVFSTNDDELIFPKQKDWIKAVIDFVKDRKDLFLVIRVHPRDFPNKRENLKSEHATLLEQELRCLPDNVRVNWPSDNISLYDLAENADVFLNAWSTAGEEMTLLGVPVVIYSPDLVTYPSDLNYLGRSREDYFNKIEQALQDGWSFERIRMAYRWYVLKFKGLAISFPESLSLYSAGLRQKSLVHRGLEKVYAKATCFFSSDCRKEYHIRHQFEDCHRRAKSLRQKDLVVRLIREGKNIFHDCFEVAPEAGITLDLETKTLQQEIKRLGVAVKGMDWVRE